MWPIDIRSDITIFNIYNETKLQATVLRDVYWREDHNTRYYDAQHLASRTITTEDRVTCMIKPDTLNDNQRTYLPHNLWLPLGDEEREKHWTAIKGDRIVKGVVTDVFNKAADLERFFGYDVVFSITQVILNLFGSRNMQHLKVIGR